MLSASPIADYAASLAHELAFDAPLSRRVRQEVEDHLWEAAEAGEGSVEAQRRAIARFGDAREIAAHYAAGSLFRQTKRMGTAAVLVIAGIFLSMKFRLTWYATMHWGVGAEAQAVLAAAMPVMRVVFMAAMALGILGWISIVLRRTPAILRPVHRRQLRLTQLLCAAAGATVAISVAGDIALTALRLAGTPWSGHALIPVVLVAAEIVVTAVLAVQLIGTIRRTGFAAALPTA